MAVIAVVQQLEKKSQKQDGEKKKTTKVRPGGFCDWKKEGRGNEETTTFIKFQEQMRTISPRSTV